MEKLNQLASLSDHATRHAPASWGAPKRGNPVTTSIRLYINGQCAFDFDVSIFDAGRERANSHQKLNSAASRSLEAESTAAMHRTRIHGKLAARKLELTISEGAIYEMPAIDNDNLVRKTLAINLPKSGMLNIRVV
jgi:hypothetical protein